MGVVTITHGGRIFRFRTDPTGITWTYNLNVNVDETYGGRVVQLLSIRLGDLVVEASSGAARWDYYKDLIDFCRNVVFDQKETGEPAIFSYPTKGYELKVFLSNIPYSDEVGNTHFPFRLRFKIQEDVSGVISSESMGSELDKVRDGIGYERNDYNYPQDRYDDPVKDTTIETDTGGEVATNSPIGGSM